MPSRLSSAEALSGISASPRSRPLSAPWRDRSTCRARGHRALQRRWTPSLGKRLGASRRNAIIFGQLVPSSGVCAAGIGPDGKQKNSERRSEKSLHFECSVGVFKSLARGRLTGPQACLRPNRLAMRMASEPICPHAGAGRRAPGCTPRRQKIRRRPCTALRPGRARPTTSASTAGSNAGASGCSAATAATAAECEAISFAIGHIPSSPCWRSAVYANKPVFVYC